MLKRHLTHIALFSFLCQMKTFPKLKPIIFIFLLEQEGTKRQRLGHQTAGDLVLPLLLTMYIFWLYIIKSCPPEPLVCIYHRLCEGF